MKKLLIIGVVLIVLVAGVLVVGVSNLGPIIKNAVNTYGPQMTKTDLRVEDVSISILSGTAGIKDFFLGNPAGFTSSEAMKVASIVIDIDEKSLTGDTIIVNSIAVIAPAITYEKSRSSDNFKTIMRNVSSYSGPSKAPQETSTQESASGGGKKILVRDFVLKQGTVTLAASMIKGQSISARLPDIHLTNIGGQGASPQKVFSEIAAALYKEITSPVVRDSLNQSLKDLGKSLDSLEDDAKKQAGGLIKGLFGE